MSLLKNDGAKGEIAMRLASWTGWRLLPVLVIAGLFLGGLLLVGQPGSAKDPKDDSKDTKDSKTTKKSDTVKAPAPLPPPPFTVHSKAAKDVPEMVKAINTSVEAKWKENSITPSRYVDDYEFVRRASLDIIGRIAKPTEITEYMKDPKDTRRSLLIDRLLSSEDYARHWSDLWTNWLLSRAGVFGRGPYHEQMKIWLEDQFAQNKPYNILMQELITATGSNKENGAVNFILAHTGEMVPAGKRGEEGQFEMVPLTSRVTRLFLGTQVQCCQCHDHPFQAALKQNHFWGVNAFLRQVQRNGTPPMERMRMMTYPTLTLIDNKSVNSDASVFYEKRNGVVLQTKAEFLPSGEGKRGPRLAGGDDRPNARRIELASFLGEHENFPKAVVNRMWGVFFGRGFVNPIDDFNDQNQPSNPELLNEVASRFKHYNYDLKKLIRWIANSTPYHLSYVANKTNDKQEQEVLFSRMILKSMTPEQLFESLQVATDPLGTTTKDSRAQARDRWLNNLVANFGDDEGNEVNFNGTVVQALMMMNGQDINDAISKKDKSAVALAMVKSRMPMQVVTQLYLTALNRPPTPQETKTIMDRMSLRPQFASLDARNPNGKYQDLFWALLNSNEFLLNH